MGGGFFAHYSALPIRMTWDTFGEENGAASFDEMVARIGRYRRGGVDVHGDQVGCLVLVEPFFLDESEWIAPPADWGPNIVQGKGYDSDGAEGARQPPNRQPSTSSGTATRCSAADARYGCGTTYLYGIVGGMEKTTVYLPDDLKRALRRTARATGRSEAELIREGIGVVTGAHRIAEPRLPLFKSGQPDLAERVDEALRGFGER